MQAFLKSGAVILPIFPLMNLPLPPPQLELVESTERGIPNEESERPGPISIEAKGNRRV
jgi:hypothetical protein